MPVGGAIKMGWPNRITVGRLLLIGPFVVCLLNLNDPGRGWMRYAAVAIFAAMALSDLVDGWLARRLHDESPLGAFLDPLADKLLVTTAVIILCVVGIQASPDQGGRAIRLPNWVAVCAIGKDMIVSLGFLVVYLCTGQVFIRPSRLGKWCTTVQLATVLSILVWLDLPPWAAPLPKVLWTVAAVLAAVAAIDYIRTGSRYVAAAGGREVCEEPGSERSG